jgi:hypothetical protein
VTFPPEIIDAAIILSAEFFAPLILTFPLSGFPPLITYLAINSQIIEINIILSKDIIANEVKNG